MIRVGIVTISDSAAAGTREDRSGPELAAKVGQFGWQVVETQIIPDDAPRISETLLALRHCDVILTTGGTGVAPRDRTPEVTRSIADREIPGFGELMRQKGREKTPLADLSRSSAFTLDKTLVINLPGSPKGAIESLEAVVHLIPHAVELLHGKTEH